MAAVMLSTLQCLLILVSVSAVGCGPLPLPRPPVGLGLANAPQPSDAALYTVYRNRRSEPYAPVLRPSGVAVLPDGAFFYADYGAGLLHRFDYEGYYDVSADAPPQGDMKPLAVAAHGFFVYALDGASRRVIRYNEQGAYRDVLLDVATLDPIDPIDPVAMAVDRDGRLAICDVASHRVLLTGSFLQLDTDLGDYGSLPGQLNDPRGVAFGEGGVLYVADRGNRRVQAFDRTGLLLGTTLSLGGTNDLFIAPTSICTDRFGNVFVADPARGAVVVLTPDLELLFVIGEGEMEDDSLQRPISCTVGGDDLLYVADVGNNALFVYALIYP